MKESLRHIGDTNRVIALSELFLSNKDSPTIAFNFLDDGETVLLPEMVCLRIILGYAPFTARSRKSGTGLSRKETIAGTVSCTD